jgi:hypothetical protein
VNNCSSSLQYDGQIMSNKQQQMKEWKDETRSIVKKKGVPCLGQ